MNTAPLSSQGGGAYQRVTEALNRHGRVINQTRPGDAMAQCPAHDDGRPSLHISDNDGHTLLWCFAGCDTGDVLAVLELTPADLFDNQREKVYGYTDHAGKITRKVHRTPDKGFWQDGDLSRDDLYQLPEVITAVAAGRPVYLTEGEKDVHAIMNAGQIASTAPQGGGNFNKVDVSPLHGADVIAIVDRDDTGNRWAEQVRDRLAGLAHTVRFVQSAAGKDAADHLMAGHRLADLQPYLFDQPPATGLDLSLIDWQELWTEKEPDMEWIAEPLLPARRLIAMYSPPKAGKSLLMLEIAAAIATGCDVLGHHTEQRRVLYVDFENDPRQDIRPRLQAMGYAPHQLADLVYLSFPVLAGLDTPAGGRELVELATLKQCQVVIIDTVSRAVTGPENENDTWLAFYLHTGLKLKKAGIALVRLDHTGKDVGRGQRGGSAKSGDVDAVWSLLPAGDQQIRLTCDGARFPLATKELLLSRRTDPLRHQVSGASDTVGAGYLIAHLDRLKIDPQMGGNKAGEVLREAGIKATAADIVTAQRARRSVTETRSERVVDHDSDEQP